LGFVTRQTASFGAGMWEPKKGRCQSLNQTLANQNGTGSGVRLMVSFSQQA
jgi:hypothetical protein